MPPMNQLFWAAFWIGVYLALVLTPLFVLLLEPVPGTGDFWWDLSIALGFAGLAMMGVQFLLTARFKRAAAPYGIDIIYYFHRYLALVALGLVLAHPALLIAVNPAFLSFLNPLDAPWPMTAGVLSIAAMLALVATAVWRKALGLHYDGWRIWHGLLATAAVALALAHLHGIGYYVAAPWKRALWTTIGLSWIAVLAYVRLVRPWRLLRRPYVVTDVRPERGDAWTVALKPQGHAGVTFEPGQFAWVTLRATPYAMKEHPFSMSSSPTREAGRLEFTIKELGDFTRTVKDLRPGETAYVDAPYGAFTIDRARAPGFVFVAGGIGIAPIMSILRALADRDDRRPILLIYAYRRWERLTFREEITALSDRLDLRTVFVLEEPPSEWTGERGRVTREILERHLPAGSREFACFLCGPEAMTRSVEALLHGLGVPLGRLHTELFDLV